ncbi:MAG: GntR family transcriptional regulator [Acetobacteraceae bacterium]|nr:GntR family transcriptional regulator [Acetobacteraceae bacterium]
MSVLTAVARANRHYPVTPSGEARPLLRDEAYAKIKAHLLQENPDAFYSERALAARLGLGLAPVRSALERLRAEGLILVSPNSGFRLPEIAAREILDFYELRLVIECHVVRSLAGRLSDAQANQIEDILDEQETSAASGNTGRYHVLDLEFHTVLAAFHGNPEMERALRQLRDKMYRLSRRMHRAHPERLVTNAAQHRGIFDAVRAGKVDEAEVRMRSHLDWGRRFTLDPDQRNMSGHELPR